MSGFRTWRRGRDSNPRYGRFPYTALAVRRFRPLSHLSVADIVYYISMPLSVSLEVENCSMIAFTDIEMTGVNALRNEIIELGLITADSDSLEIKDAWTTKVHPLSHPLKANKHSLDITGYNVNDWKHALHPRDAITEYVRRATDSVFISEAIQTIDWPFLDKAFRNYGIDHNFIGRIDITHIIRKRLSGRTGFEKFSMREASVHLKIPPEKTPHRAILGASRAYAIYALLEGKDSDDRPLEPLEVEKRVIWALSQLDDNAFLP
jgi:DNA polymerase III epsilon subunit-like protein